MDPHTSIINHINPHPKQLHPHPNILDLYQIQAHNFTEQHDPLKDIPNLLNKKTLPKSKSTGHQITKNLTILTNAQIILTNNLWDDRTTNIPHLQNHHDAPIQYTPPDFIELQIDHLSHLSIHEINHNLLSNLILTQHTFINEHVHNIQYLLLYQTHHIEQHIQIRFTTNHTQNIDHLSTLNFQKNQPNTDHLTHPKQDTK